MNITDPRHLALQEAKKQNPDKKVTLSGEFIIVASTQKEINQKESLLFSSKNNRHIEGVDHWRVYLDRVQE